MLDTFRKTNELWQDIQEEQAEDIRRLKMLEMSRLLIESARLPDEDLAAISQTGELTDLFIAYQQIGDTIPDFLQRALPHMEPAFTSGAFHDQLQALNQQLVGIKNQYQDVKKQHAQVLETRKELTSHKTQYDNLCKEIETLTAFQTKVSEKSIETLKQEIHTLKESTEQIQPIYEKHLAEKEELSALNQSMLALISQYDSTDVSDASHITSLMEMAKDLSEKLDRQWDQYDIQLAQELRKLKKRNTMYTDILEKMSTTLKDLENTIAHETHNREIYEKRFLANKGLVSDMEQRSKKPIPQEIKDAAALSQKINELLKQFDTTLKQLIADNENISQQIRRLNNS